MFFMERQYNYSGKIFKYLMSLKAINCYSVLISDQILSFLNNKYVEYLIDVKLLYLKAFGEKRT